MKSKRKATPKVAKVENTIEALVNLMAGKKEPVRMEYDSYVLLRDLLDNAMVKFENDFRTACRFIPSQPLSEIRKGIPSGIDKAHKIFSEHYSKMRQAKVQLHAAAASTYKDHPNLDMRKFWGLDE